MKLAWQHVVAAGAAVLVLLMAWFSGPLLRLSGSDRIILGSGILLIGAAAIAGFLLWAR
jgi:hypothetical protein